MSVYVPAACLWLTHVLNLSIVTSFHSNVSQEVKRERGAKGANREIDFGNGMYAITCMFPALGDKLACKKQHFCRHFYFIYYFIRVPFFCSIFILNCCSKLWHIIQLCGHASRCWPGFWFSASERHNLT